MTEPRFKISPPWVIYIHKLEALFDGDPQIAFNVDYASEKPSVTMSTNNPEKAAALMKLLPDEVKFGNVALGITVDCPEVPNLAFATTKELFDAAFTGNPAFEACITPVAEGYWYINFTYVIFKNYVVQFFADNINDAHGVISTLYQEIAAEIFKDCNFTYGVCYCTDVEHGKLGKPLGEWP